MSTSTVMARLDRATQAERVCAPVTLSARGRALTGWPAYAGHDKGKYE